MTMECPKRPGSVSVWLGYFESEEALFDYVEQSSDEEGGFESAFLQDFPLGWYDHDFSEANFFGAQDVRAALLGHSYGESFVDRVLADIPSAERFNSTYLIYDVDASSVGGFVGRLRFLGVYPYCSV